MYVFLYINIFIYNYYLPKKIIISSGSYIRSLHTARYSTLSPNKKNICMYNIYIFIIETPCFTSAIGLAQRSPRIWRLYRKLFFSRSHRRCLYTKIIEKPHKINYVFFWYYLHNYLLTCKYRSWASLENEISKIIFSFLVFMQTHQQSINFHNYLQILYKNRTFVIALNFIWSSNNKTKFTHVSTSGKKLTTYFNKGFRRKKSLKTIPSHHSFIKTMRNSH